MISDVHKNKQFIPLKNSESWNKKMHLEFIYSLLQQYLVALSICWELHQGDSSKHSACSQLTRGLVGGAGSEST